MKLHLSILEKFIQLPSQDPKEIRELLDDLGLEVKGMNIESGGTVFTIETLANRGDHLSALGVARELSARLISQIKLPQVAGELTDRKSSLPIKIGTNTCSRYSLLEISFPQEATLRPEIAQVTGIHKDHHPIVDILNYVLLELGTPMHAFDREKVEGEIIIDQTTQPEEIIALDGKTYSLAVGTTVIRDRKRIIAVAGIIGCANSMVTPQTRKVALEAAAFDPVAVRKAARAMGISTDASHAFERGTDIEGITYSMKRVVLLAQGAVRDTEGVQQLGYTNVDQSHPEKRHIKLRLAEVKRHMNLPRLPEIEIITRLKHLGYGVELNETGKEATVTVPSWRLWDVAHEMDLVEDACRSFGLNRIKQEMPEILPILPEENPIERIRRLADPALHGSGFLEVITNGFYSDSDVEILQQLSPGSREKHIRLKNSVESAYSAMKITNVLHLARLIERNLRLGVLSAKVYEYTPVFFRERREGLLEYEKPTLSLALGGRWSNSEWGKEEPLPDRLLSLKGVLESAAHAIGKTLTLVPSKDPYLHPGYQGAIKIGSKICGSMGLLHPELTAALDLKHEILIAELDLEPLFTPSDPYEFREVSSHPSIRRDLTLRVGLREPSAAVEKIAASLKIENLNSISIVDEFRKAEEDFRRVSYRFTFQRIDRTLEHQEVDGDMGLILKALQEKDFCLV